MECGMERRFHRGFTASEKKELWDRWKRGESLKAIGRAFGKPSSSIYFLVAPHGGIRPAERRRSRLALTLSEREEISRGAGNLAAMAAMIATERRFRMTMPGRGLVVRSVVNWRTVRGYGRQWRGS
jgi:hypothetical protein